MVKKGEFLLQIDGNQDKRSGSIEVQQSELVLNTAMPMVPSLSATGGKLVITANASFDRHVDVSVDGGKVDLAEGVTMKCGWLYLDGKTEPEQPGTYGSSQSAAQFKDDEHFSGTGVLWARNGAGTLMLVR